MEQRDQLLSSWKEIAAYLRCHKRTCLRWEKRFGLPIHRAGDSESRSLVYAYKKELDEWLRTQKDKQNDRIHRSQIRDFLIRKGRLPALALLVLITAVVLLVFRGNIQRRDPHDFRIDKSRLVLLDVKGRTLGSYDTGHDNLWEESEYRKYSFFRRTNEAGGRRLPRIVMKDVNDDGRNEVLFVIHTYDDDRPGRLVCLDARGRFLWEHTPERQVSFGGKPYPPSEFMITAVDLIEFNGRKKILAIGQHSFDFPSFISILSTEGRSQEEYWHSGRILDYCCLDLDADHRNELLLAGTNNEYKKGFLAVLEFGRMSGASLQSGGYLCTSRARAHERAYILLPRTPVDMIEAEREGVHYLDSTAPNKLNLITTYSHILYQLSFKLELVDVVLMDSYLKKAFQYRLDGMISKEDANNEVLIQKLQNSILFIDGYEWKTILQGNNFHRFQ